RWDDYQHRLTDLGGVGKKLSQVTLTADVKLSASLKGPTELRRSHSLSDIASELGTKLQSERWKFVRLSLLPQPAPFFTADKSSGDLLRSCDAVQINIESPTPSSSQILTPSSEAKSISTDSEYAHLKVMDNDECAKKRYTSRKLKAKRVMQAVVRLQ
ncbi:hypothetical protein X975_21811, partial [Stegodyphus mimosarum]